MSGRPEREGDLTCPSNQNRHLSVVVQPLQETEHSYLNGSSEVCPPPIYVSDEGAWGIVGDVTSLWGFGEWFAFKWEIALHQLLPQPRIVAWRVLVLVDER